MNLRSKHKYAACALALVLAMRPSAVIAADEPASGSGSSSGAMIDAGMKYVPPTPIQAENEDRSNKNGAAIAAAAIGAAMAGMSCIMLMKAAMEAEDPKEKQQLMAQALQQCGQAAQSALSAAQNQDQKKKLQTPEAPPETTIDTKAFSNPKKESGEGPALATLGSSSPDDNTPQELTSGGEVPVAVLPGGQELKGGEIGGGGGVKFEPPQGTLNPIGEGRLSNNENAPGGTTAGGTGVSTLSMGGIGTGARPGALPEGGTLSAPAASVTQTAGGRSSDRGVASDLGSGGSDEDKGGSSLESMMANLFGGPKDGIEGTAIGGGVDILALQGKGKDGKAGPPPNIFEYASFRYKKAAYQEGKIRARANGKVRSASVKPIDASPTLASTQP